MQSLLRIFAFAVLACALVSLSEATPCSAELSSDMKMLMEYNKCLKPLDDRCYEEFGDELVELSDGQVEPAATACAELKSLEMDCCGKARRAVNQFARM